MDDWWDDLDRSLLRCLADNGAMAPTEIAGRLGLSEDAITSLICLLAQERKVSIRLVDCHPDVRTSEGVRAA